MTVSYSVCDPGVHRLPGFYGVRGGSPRGGDGSGDCHDGCHHPQTPKSGCLEVRIVVRSTVLPRGGADEDAHRQLHLVHRLRAAHFSLQVRHADFSQTIVTPSYSEKQLHGGRNHRPNHWTPGVSSRSILFIVCMSPICLFGFEMKISPCFFFLFGGVSVNVNFLLLYCIFSLYFPGVCSCVVGVCK